MGSHQSVTYKKRIVTYEADNRIDYICGVKPGGYYIIKRDFSNFDTSTRDEMMSFTDVKGMIEYLKDKVTNPKNCY
jgi:hypothetical protein